MPSWTVRWSSSWLCGPPEVPGTNFPAVQRSEQFQRLRRTHRSFVFPSAVAFLAWYLLYAFLAICTPAFMSTRILGNINLGLQQFVTTFDHCGVRGVHQPHAGPAGHRPGRAARTVPGPPARAAPGGPAMIVPAASALPAVHRDGDHLCHGAQPRHQHLDPRGRGGDQRQPGHARARGEVRHQRDVQAGLRLPGPGPRVRRRHHLLAVVAGLAITVSASANLPTILNSLYRRASPAAGRWRPCTAGWSCPWCSSSSRR